MLANFGMLPASPLKHDSSKLDQDDASCLASTCALTRQNSLESILSDTPSPPSSPPLASSSAGDEDSVDAVRVPFAQRRFSIRMHEECQTQQHIDCDLLGEARTAPEPSSRTQPAPVSFAQKRFAIQMGEHSAQEEIFSCPSLEATEYPDVLEKSTPAPIQSRPASLAQKRFAIRMRDEEGNFCPTLPMDLEYPQVCEDRCPPIVQVCQAAKLTSGTEEADATDLLESGPIRMSLAQKRFAIRMHEDDSAQVETPQQCAYGVTLEQAGSSESTLTEVQTFAQKRFAIRMGEQGTTSQSPPENKTASQSTKAVESERVEQPKVSFAMKRFAIRMHDDLGLGDCF